MRISMIHVDDREQKPSSAEMVRAIQEHMPARIDRQDCGDMAWVCQADRDGEKSSRHVVERKSIEDAINSVRDGRLKSFIEKAHELQAHCYLMVEGDFDSVVQYGERTWTFDSFDNLLLSVQDMGLPVVRSRSIHHSAKRIVSLAHRSMRPRRALDTPGLPDVPSKEPHRAAIRTLLTYPGIGIVTARKLNEQYGSIDNVNEAFSEGDAVRIRGLAEPGVKRVCRHLSDTN